MSEGMFLFQAFYNIANTVSIDVFEAPACCRLKQWREALLPSYKAITLD